MDSQATKKKRRQECRYYSCHVNTNLKKCEYCGEEFCEEHLNPIFPGMPRFHSDSQEDRIYMEQRRKKGHPCSEYKKFYDRKRKEEKKRYSEALNKFLDVPIKRGLHQPENLPPDKYWYSKASSEIPELPKSGKHNPKANSQAEHSTKGRLLKYILLLSFSVLILYFLLTPDGNKQLFNLINVTLHNNPILHK